MSKEIPEFTETEAKSTRLWQRRWFRLLLIWAIWTFVGLIFTFQFYFTNYRSERPVPFLNSLYIQLSWVYLWALATPLVLWLARRFPIERQSWLRHTVIHVLTSITLSCIVTALVHLLIYLRVGRALGKPWSFDRMTRFVVENFSEGLGVYLLIILASYAFSYYQRYRKGELRASQLEAQLSQAQLQALKMQLHPHFLFNTLHSISALLNKDTEAARKMITRLGDFLRLTLENSGMQEVTLEKEMEFLKCYLEIERVRFQDRLNTQIDVDARALDLEVPNLILQPIVENALRHGIAPRSTPGLIEIRAEQQNGTLRIRVRDNGPGLPVNRSNGTLFKKGLGLANTQRRLDRLYGAAHRFEVANAPEGGLVVTLEIPSKRQAASHTPDQ
ncbi:MAG TPA: histidine kinase [Pyrinomonadaceae bacterium]|jgi:signal transduction histidine kinase